MPATGSYTVCSATEFTYTAHLALHAKPSSATVYKLQVAPGAFQSRSGATSTSQSFTLAYDTFAEETPPGPSIAVTGIEVTESPANTTVSYTVSGLDDRVTTFTSSLSETLRTKLDSLEGLDTLLAEYKAGLSGIGSFGNDLGADQSELEQAIVRFGEETMGRAGSWPTESPTPPASKDTPCATEPSLSWGAVSTGILNSNLFFRDTELRTPDRWLALRNRFRSQRFRPYGQDAHLWRRQSVRPLVWQVRVYVRSSSSRTYPDF